MPREATAWDTPDESEVLGYFDSCSNWGRWGNEDEFGTLNYITPEVRQRASRQVIDGISVSCARLIPTLKAEVDFWHPPLHYMTASGDAWADVPTKPGRVQTSEDFIGLEVHGVSVTHVDSLCHVFRDGRMYNGRPANLVSTAAGARVMSVDTLRDGIVGRGVLLDIPALRDQEWLEPGDPVFPEDLEAAAGRVGVTVEPGDIVLCRLGTMARRAAVGPSTEVFVLRPGLHASCMPWLHRHQVAALGSDGAQDVNPSGYDTLTVPVHQIGMVAMGLCLIDNCDLEALATTCQRLGRWEFMFTVAPLRVENGTGSPVNPIALF